MRLGRRGLRHRQILRHPHLLFYFVTWLRFCLCFLRMLLRGCFLFFRLRGVWIVFNMFSALVFFFLSFSSSP